MEINIYKSWTLKYASNFAIYWNLTSWKKYAKCSTILNQTQSELRAFHRRQFNLSTFREPRSTVQTHESLNIGCRSAPHLLLWLLWTGPLLHAYQPHTQLTASSKRGRRWLSGKNSWFVNRMYTNGTFLSTFIAAVSRQLATKVLSQLA